MGDNDEGDAFFFVEIEKKILDLFAGGRVEIAGGLVSKDDFGVIDDGPGDADTLFLTAGEIVSLIFGFVVELDDFERLHGEVLASAATGARDLEWEENIVEDGVAGIHEELLEDEAEVAVAEAIKLTRLELGGISAIDDDVAAGGTVEEGEQVHKGGLAGAGFAEDGDCLARVDF